MLRFWTVVLTLALVSLAAVPGEARGACGSALHDYYAARVAAERERNAAMDTALHEYAAAMDAATLNYAAATNTFSLDDKLAAERKYNGTRNAAMRDYKAVMVAAMREYDDTMDAAMRDCFTAMIEKNRHDIDAMMGPRLTRIFSARDAVRKAAWDDLVGAIRVARRNYEASPKTEKDRGVRDAAIDAARRDYGAALGVTWR